MRSLRPFIRFHQFRLDEGRRALGQLQGLRAELVNKVADLVEEAAGERRLAAQDTELNWTYGSYARALIQRQENLTKSIAEIEEKIDDAREAVTEAHLELRKYETVQERAEERAAREEARREQLQLEEVAITQKRLRDRNQA